jgi:DNA-binding NarL/FixJ family response regulator
MVIEDKEIACAELKKLLECMTDISIVAEASTAEAAVDIAKQEHPDFIVMNIRFLGNDIGVIRSIKREVSAKLILFSSRNDEQQIFEGLAAGADAICLDETMNKIRLNSAIHCVMDDGVWLDPPILRVILESIQIKLLKHCCTEYPEGQFPLSRREQEVMHLLIEGLSNQQIAKQLNVGCETIKTHLRHILAKLHVSGRTQAVVKALKAAAAAETRLAVAEAKRAAAAAEAQHVAYTFQQALVVLAEWKATFLKAILEKTTLDDTEMAHDDLCILGLWLYGEGKSRYGNLSSFRKLHSEHAQLHVKAAKTCSAVNEGKYDEALRMLDDIMEAVQALTVIFTDFQAQTNLTNLAVATCNHRVKDLQS